ncbi:hypothetical protein [Acetobacterium carbinolicum]|uniref:hypothetical protein n=1 Tax=Acetobacterium carbinolicum TaxID=52690 RepID=UPI003BF5EF4B
MIRKKVVLFLVEGITDQIALGAILSKLVENEQVHFEIADGNIMNCSSKSVVVKIVGSFN